MGFIKSGIVSLTLLQPGATSSDLFSEVADLYWVRISIPSNVQATCWTTAITPQAVTAIYSKGADPRSHFNRPLAASSITKTQPPLSGLTKVNQATLSFGGIPPESDDQFHARVSERLRRKDRAITSWDYENLVLQYSSKIRACRTLNHTSIPQGTDPGSITILVFPEITASKNALRPLADRSLLVDISNYILARCNPVSYTHLTLPTKA